MKEMIKSKSKSIKILGIGASFFLALILGLGDIVTNVAHAESDFFIYPTKGQSPKQQEKDKFECYTWAKQNSGFDPMKVPMATAPPPQKEPQKGGVLRGAARGSVVGVVGGAIAGDAGKGAAIGAATGALFGGMRRRQQQQQQQQAEQQWAQEQANQYAQKRNSYNRAYAACLEARDYKVK